MDVLIVLVFVSLVMVGGAILLFLHGIKGGDFEHGDRLSLLPLEPDAGDAGASTSNGPSRDPPLSHENEITGPPRPSDVIPSPPDS